MVRGRGRLNKVDIALMKVDKKVSTRWTSLSVVDSFVHPLRLMKVDKKWGSDVSHGGISMNSSGAILAICHCQARTYRRLSILVCCQLPNELFYWFKKNCQR